jgi:hypothetical protein
MAADPTRADGYPQVAPIAVEMWKKEKFANSDNFSIFRV